MAAKPLMIWDAKHNANGGVYFQGRPADPAFRQTVAEDFLTNPRTVAEAARSWKKSDSFVKGCVNDFLFHGTLSPFTSGGNHNPVAFCFEDLAYLDVLVQSNPRAHAWQHRLRLIQDLNLDVPISTVRHAIHKVLGYSKQVLGKIASQRYAPNNILKLAAYQQFIQPLDMSTVAFFDESGVSTRTGNSRYGFGRVGQRTYAVDPLTNSVNHSVMAMCSVRFPVQAITIAGGAKANDVVNYVTIVGPLLVAFGIQVVVMDNCKTHYDYRLRALLNGMGLRLVFLPPYSPYLNPIEMVFGKMKHLLKFKRAELQAGNIVGSVAEALSQVTRNDIIGYYRHSTYLITRRRLENTPKIITWF